MPADASATVQLDHARLMLGQTRFHFDCEFRSGAITAVVGPSGAGKSTLLNLVSGFERPNSGAVRIGGVDVTRLAPAERPISLVFQDNNLFSHLDLFTNIGLGIHPALRLQLADRMVISQALERVGLGGYERRLPGSLSGGERQRAAFARALVRRRPVLLLDEPFAALDPGLRASMADLLAELHRETGATVLLVTHDPRELERLADRVVFIADGSVLVDAPTAQFLARHDLSLVRDFLGIGSCAKPSP
jgi:thiamine transport system ATP-binding protein